MTAGPGCGILAGEMPARWTHVVLQVAELERSIAFYRRFCGLEVVRDGRPRGHTVWLGPHDAAGTPAATDAPGTPRFVLVLYQHAVSARLDHLGFQCDAREEVDRIAKDAAALGILVEPPFDGGGDIGYVTQIEDPDGHRVEFTYGQPLAGLG